MTEAPGERPQEVESGGPWPFVTFRICRFRDGSHRVWHSRAHRKGLRPETPERRVSLGARLRDGLWNPSSLNWWIGVVFAMGALGFLAGSLGGLAPRPELEGLLDAGTSNRVFFAASIPFAVAAYLQLFQAANARGLPPAGGAAPDHTAWLGWRPSDIGWLSCALQFAGTLLFNVNTFDAMLPHLDWLQQDTAIWAPDLVGSVLFLTSGYLAFVESGHAHFAWRPGSLAWWTTGVNLLGCVAFLVAAFFAFVPAHPTRLDASSLALVFTGIGAGAFLVGSLLMLPESAVPAAP